MLCTALLLGLASPSPQESASLRVESRGPGPVLLGEVAAGESRTLVVPLVSRSERVARLVPGRDGLVVRILGPRGLSLRRFAARALPHRDDERLIVDGEGTQLLAGEPRLPRRVTLGGDDVLPALFRQDGVLAGPGRLEVLPPEVGSGALGLLLVADERPGTRADLLVESSRRSVGLRAGPAPTLLRAAPAVAFGLELGLDGPCRIDQLAFVPLRPPPAEAVELSLLEVLRLAAPDPALPPSALVGSVPGEAGLELHLEPPPSAPETTTWTVLLELEAGAEEVPPLPLAVDAGGPPRRGLREADDAGLAFCHFEGPDLQLDIRPTMGPGVALGDVDGDGWNDLYLVQGAGREGSDRPQNHLLLNRGGWRFEDVTEASGTGDRGAGMGALFLDADGDGDLDLYVANRGADVLLENDGRGVFRDVSEAAGLTGERWSAGVAAADADADGDLDLYVTSYLLYDEARMPPEDELGRFQREDPTPMLPFAFPGERNTFLRNDCRAADELPGSASRLRFTDVTEALGLADETGRGMQPLFWDFDRDGRADLYVANDVSFNVLWRGEAGGGFRDVSFSTGMDDPRGGMGVAAEDVDGDGDEDLFLTNWQLEPNALYRNELVSSRTRKTRAATFRDVTVQAGLAGPSVGYTAWGAWFLDLELDGDLDLYVANGYTSPDYESTGICVGQPDHLYLNDGEGRFALAPPALGPDPAVSLASRAVVGDDLDHDGDVDLIVTANNGPVRLLENVFERRGSWLTLRLRQRGANRFGIGAEVSLHAGERLIGRRTLRAGTSYLAGNAPELHFGLGERTSGLEVRVRWPDGARSTHAVPSVDRILELARP